MSRPISSRLARTKLAAAGSARMEADSRVSPRTLPPPNDGDHDTRVAVDGFGVGRHPRGPGYQEVLPRASRFSAAGSREHTGGRWRLSGRLPRRDARARGGVRVREV